MVAKVFRSEVWVEKYRPKCDPKMGRNFFQLFFPLTDFNISGRKRCARRWTLTCQKDFPDPMSRTREKPLKPVLRMRFHLWNSYMGEKKISEKIEVKVANDRELNGEQFSPQSTYMKCDYLYPKIAFFQKVGAFSGFSVLTDLTMCYSV